MDIPESDEDLLPVFVPALVVVLSEHERKLGRPLTEHEVLEIRDNSVVVVMRQEHQNEMDQRRGYTDIDPEDAWEQWQAFREARFGADEA